MPRLVATVLLGHSLTYKFYTFIKDNTHGLENDLNFLKVLHQIVVQLQGNPRYLLEIDSDFHVSSSLFSSLGKNPLVKEMQLKTIEGFLRAVDFA